MYSPEELIKSLPICHSSDEAFDWLCNDRTLDELERLANDIDSALQAYSKIKDAISDVLEFFSPRYLNILNEWGRHYKNPHNITVTRGEYGGYVFSYNKKVFVKVLPNLSDLNFQK